jgi:hypothetical protein
VAVALAAPMRMHPPRTWCPGGVTVPVVLISSGGALDALVAAVAAGAPASVMRTPRELELAHSVQLLAQKRAKGVSVLVRKLLRAVPDLDVAALCVSLMDVSGDMLDHPETDRRLLALEIVEVVCLTLTHAMAAAMDAAQAPVHADRSGGAAGGEPKADRSVASIHAAIARVHEHAAAWAAARTPASLARLLPAKDLFEALSPPPLVLSGHAASLTPY